MGLYLNERGAIQHLIIKHFGTKMSKRFMVRVDTDIFKASEDESIFNRKKAGTEHIHIFFDFLEIADIPPTVDRRFFELILLRSFRDAIKSGAVSIDTVREVTDLKTAATRKQEIKKKKKEKILEAFKEARYYANKVKTRRVKLPDVGEITKIELGGEKNGKTN